jgi:hypothetical protein
MYTIWQNVRHNNAHCALLGLVKYNKRRSAHNHDRQVRVD